MIKISVIKEDVLILNRYLFTDLQSSEIQRADSQYKYILLHFLFVADLLLDDAFIFTDSTKSEMDKQYVKGFLISFIGLYDIWNFKIALFYGH